MWLRVAGVCQCDLVHRYVSKYSLLHPYHHHVSKSLQRVMPWYIYKLFFKKYFFSCLNFFNFIFHHLEFFPSPQLSNIVIVVNRQCRQLTSYFSLFSSTPFDFPYPLFFLFISFSFFMIFIHYRNIVTTIMFFLQQLVHVRVKKF